MEAFMVFFNLGLAGRFHVTQDHCQLPSFPWRQIPAIRPKGFAWLISKGHMATSTGQVLKKRHCSYGDTSQPTPELACWNEGREGCPLAWLRFHPLRLHRDHIPQVRQVPQTLQPRQTQQTQQTQQAQHHRQVPIQSVLLLRLVRLPRVLAQQDLPRGAGIPVRCVPFARSLRFLLLRLPPVLRQSLCQEYKTTVSSILR